MNINKIDIMSVLMNKYIHADSFVALPNIPDKSVDLIITDPMYDLMDFMKEELHEHFLRICRGTIIVFSPPENQWIRPADQYGFWIKPISTKNTSKRYSRFVEMLFFYENGIWNNNRHWSQYTNVFTDLVDNSSNHPYRKPPSLIERLILNHSNVGSIVFDPFCGSGVVGKVGKRLGRNFICIEIIKDYLIENSCEPNMDMIEWFQ